MIKAALIGLAAVAGMIAGEMGADKVAAMRQTRTDRRCREGDRSAQDA